MGHIGKTTGVVIFEPLDIPGEQAPREAAAPQRAPEPAPATAAPAAEPVPA